MAFFYPSRKRSFEGFSAFSLSSPSPSSPYSTTLSERPFLSSRVPNIFTREQLQENGGNGGGNSNGKLNSFPSSVLKKKDELVGWGLEKFERVPKGSTLLAALILNGPTVKSFGKYLLSLFIEPIIRRLIESVFDYVISRVSCSATFDSRDETFRWMIDWIRLHPGMVDVEDFHVCSSYGLYGLSSANDNTEFTTERQLYYSPNIGTHWFKHRSKWLRISRVRHDTGGVNIVRESLTIRMFFANKELLKGVIADAQKQAREREGQTTSIFVPDNLGTWVRSCSKAKRSLSSVVLADNLVESLLDDVCTFYSSDLWYRERGIPWRRGYLLEGLPGCGKTSFITALAGELSLDIYSINLSSKTVNDEMLSELLANTPQHCLLLLEDIEVAACSIEEDRHSSVTRSGLLNAIDGVAAVEGRILFMTSNKPDSLDDAFLRPGRVDVREHFSLAKSHHAREMFAKFFPDAPVQWVEEFGRKFQDDLVNIASVQGFLMEHREDPERAVTEIERLFTHSHHFSLHHYHHYSYPTLKKEEEEKGGEEEKKEEEEKGGKEEKKEEEEKGGVVAKKEEEEK